MPDYLIIEIPGYKGTSCIPEIKAIPLAPVEHLFYVNGKECKRI